MDAMTNDSINTATSAAPSVSVHVHGYRNGGPRSYETFRVSWAVGRDASTLDFRTREARELVARGLAGVEYARGAWRRGVAEDRARRAAYRAVELLSAAAA
jgi:hypothetical protein